MAILMLLDRDNVVANPIEDASYSYKRGDIIEVLDDSRHDGNLTANPVSSPWILVKITGVTKAQAMKYMQVRISDVLLDDRGQPLQLGPRLYRILVDSIPVSIRNQIIANRYVEVTLNQIRNYIKNLTTGQVGG